MNFLARLGRRTVKIIAILLAVIVGLEVVYLVVGNVMLRAGTVERLLNKRPEKTLVHYESAYTLFPGHAVVKGFKIRSQATRSQIEAQGDWVRALVNPLPLLWKTVHIVRADARGAEFRMRRRPVTPEELKDNRPQGAEVGRVDHQQPGGRRARGLDRRLQADRTRVGRRRDVDRAGALARARRGLGRLPRAAGRGRRQAVPGGCEAE
nr:hypothetical protein [Acidobacteriota bacterium]